MNLNSNFSRGLVSSGKLHTPTVRRSNRARTMARHKARQARKNQAELERRKVLDAAITGRTTDKPTIPQTPAMAPRQTLLGRVKNWIRKAGF